MSNMFCEQCGQALKSGDKFCQGCGRPVAQVPQQPVIQQPLVQPVQQPSYQPQPTFGAPATKPSTNLPAIIAAVVVIVLIVIGVGGIMVWNMIKPPVLKSSEDATKQSSPSSTPGVLPSASSNTAQTPSQPADQQKPGAGYVGNWIVADMQPGEGDTGTYAVRRDGSKLVLKLKSDIDKGAATPRAEFEASDSPSLDGMYFDDEGKQIKIKMELTADKSKMVLTLLPEASEPIPVTLVRAKGESWLGK